MSTFGGKIQEIPGISVDRFDYNNLHSEVYFLSHCHVDHMVGLHETQFQNMLRGENRFIYVSHVSKAILKQLHPKIENQLKELDFYSPTSINLKNRAISVTPIPSGHCPGSVMLLFECDKIILYTGDYRMNCSDLKRCKALYDSFGKLKLIEKIYLDTTFFFREYQEFPTRKESLDHVCALIKEWLDADEKNIVNLKTSARYGYEYVFMEIFKRTKMPVHVNKDAYAFYSLVPEMDETITLDGSKTRIHNACGVNFREICMKYVGENTRIIRLSAMKWRTKVLEQGFVDNQNGEYSVCYSTHASYNEGLEFLKFLKPKQIEPSVLRHSEKDEEIFDSIDMLLKSENECPSKKIKLFEIIDMKEQKSSSDNDECDDFLESLLDSPPRESFE